jgi:hypothetical protein
LHPTLLRFLRFSLSSLALLGRPQKVCRCRKLFFSANFFLLGGGAEKRAAGILGARARVRG